MAILAIDTSTRFAELAIASAGQVTTIAASNPNSHIEKLAELFQELLNKAQLKSNCLEKIVLGCGPGSFTGLRIGYAFASGLASGLQIPIIERCSFRAVAQNSSKKLAVVLADAGRKEFFAGVYQGDYVFQEPKIFTEEDLLLLIEKGQKKLNQQEVVIYSNLELDVVKWGECQQVEVRGLAEALVKHMEVEEGNFSLIGLASLQPNYLRPVAALKISERNK